MANIAHITYYYPTTNQQTYFRKEYAKKSWQWFYDTKLCDRVEFSRNDAVLTSEDLVNDSRGCPSITSLLDTAFHRYDNVILTNDDIALMDNPKEIIKFFENYLQSLKPAYGKRIEVNSFLEITNPDYKYLSGKFRYHGVDTFILNKNHWTKIKPHFPLMFMGGSLWDLMLKMFIKNFFSWEYFDYTFHQIHDSPWKTTHSESPIQQTNESRDNRILYNSLLYEYLVNHELKWKYPNISIDEVVVKSNLLRQQTSKNVSCRKVYHVFQNLVSNNQEIRKREDFAKTTWKYLYKHGVIPVLNSKYQDTTYVSNKNIPFVNDILDSSPATNYEDIIIFTNTDTCLATDTYQALIDKVNEFGCCFTPRRHFEFPIKRHLNMMEVSELGQNEVKNFQQHGACLFAFTYGWWVENKHRLSNMMCNSIEWDVLFRFIMMESGDCELPNCVYHHRHVSNWKEEDSKFTNLFNIVNSNGDSYSIFNGYYMDIISKTLRDEGDLTEVFGYISQHMYSDCSAQLTISEGIVNNIKTQLNSRNFQLQKIIDKFEITYNVIGNKFFLNKELFDFQENRFPLEKVVYKLFRNDRLYRDWLVAPLDFYSLTNDEYVRKMVNCFSSVKLNNGFAVFHQDEYYRLYKLFENIGVTKVFNPSIDVKKPVSKNTQMIPIGYPVTEDIPTRKRDIDFSFIGSKTTSPSGIRKNIEFIQSDLNYKVELYDGFFENELIDMMCSFYEYDRYSMLKASHLTNLENIKNRRLQYFDIISRSKFVLCPRGSAPSSLRFWECLKAGSIPILISDDWILPDFDWDGCVIRISEKSWGNIRQNPKMIDGIINQISNEKRNAMSSKCKIAYEKFAGSEMKHYILSKI